MSDSGRASFGAAGWPVPVVTVLLWALAGLSAGWWGLKMVASGSAMTVAAPAAARLPDPLDPVVLERLLGAGPALAEGAGPVAAPSLASRFVLMGVVAGWAGGGTVLLSVDGQPPKHYRVGSAVAEGLVLQSVQGRVATIGATRGGPAAVTLELPPLVP